MTDRDHDPFLPRPNRGKAIVYITMLILFGALFLVVITEESSEEQIECDPDTDITCNDPSRIIVRFIAIPIL